MMRRPPPRFRLARRTMLAAGVVLCGYAAYHRIGTQANADTIEITPNLAGGFLAVGMTERQPGFVLLSALDKTQVEVEAVKATNAVAGARTCVSIRMGDRQVRQRLRSPEVILVSERGEIDHLAVDWNLEDFQAIRRAADCSHAAATKKGRCGAPFTDVSEMLKNWSNARVPAQLRQFLRPYAASSRRQ